MSLPTSKPSRRSAEAKGAASSRNGQHPDALTRDEQMVFMVIRERGAGDMSMVTRTEIVRRSGLTEDDVSRQLARLVERGSIRAERTSSGELAFAATG